ncbi:phage portal protein [Romboutsia ilealis]|uniref:Phage portal protein n=1 Tax=Romboutsia faecis TaxID=2764597 RepID=A0ABR7JN65_9FIRM|nr:phage portal protein [Romboutsia faecis]MBC5996371.1 phage portal protein [Romboutsia faecis]MRN24993.1 phage portal protein [Romboutsia ilealis]
MKITKRFKNAYKAFKNNSADIELEHLLDFLGLKGVNKDDLSEATYFACLKVLSESIGKLPLKLLKYTDKNGVTAARDHPLYRILKERPNPYMTASTFWSTVEYNRNHFGNAYILIDGAGEDTKLWILDDRKMQIWYDDARLLGENADIYYLYSSGSKFYKFGSEEILHFKTSHTFDGITGVSVRQQLKTSIQGNLKSQELLNKMYENGFTAKAVVQYTGSLSDDNVKTFISGIEDYATGKLENEGIRNIIPMPLGATLTPLNIKLADNQFIEVKQYSALQIASAFGIKPYQIGDYTKSSYASAEAQQLSFYVDTLLYILKQYEEEISYKLLSQYELDQGLHFKFNISVILRADLKTQIETLSTAVGNFIYTPNEARALLDMEAKEGGDKLLGNGASIPVNLAGIQYQKGDDTNE